MATLGAGLDDEETTRRLNTGYDRLGYVTDSQEEMKSKSATNLKTKTTVTNGINTINGQWINFDRQLERFSLPLPLGEGWGEGKSAVLISDERINRTGTVYDLLGQTVSYTETKRDLVESPDLLITTALSDGKYTPAGILISSKERREETGPGLNRIIETTLSDRLTDKNGRVTSEKTITAYFPHPPLRGTFPQEGKENIDLPTPLVETKTLLNAEYDENSGHMLSSQEETRRQGAVLDVTTQTNKLDMLYDKFGRLESWLEEVVEDSAKGLSTTTRVDATTHNNLGQMTDQRRTTTTQSRADDGATHLVTTVQNRNAITYNNWSQINGFTDAVENLTLGTNSVTLRSVTGYNRLGQALNYKETVTRSAQAGGVDMSETRKVDRTDQQYDTQGRLAGWMETRNSDATPDLIETVTWAGALNYDDQTDSYIQTTHRTGPNLDQTVTVNYSGAVYNSLGQITTYRQTTEDTASPEMDETLTWSQGTYNDFGQLTGSYAATDRGSTDGTISIQKTVDQADLKYDREGRQNTWVETRTDNRKPDETETVTRTGTDYEGEQVTGYSERSDLDNGVIRETILSGVGYDNRFRRDSYVEGVTTRAPGYDLTQTSGRTKTIFNDLGQLIEYEETRNGTDRPGITRAIKWTDGTYDDQGRSKGYTETVDTTGVGINHKVETMRAGTTYDPKGQPASYTETVNDFTASPDLETTTAWSAKGHDNRGRVTAQIETINRVQRSNGALLSEDKSDRYDVVFDRRGRIAEYKDKRKSSDAPDLETISTFSQASFDPVGLLLGSLETRKEWTPGDNGVSLLREETDQVGRTYDERGRVKSETHHQFQTTPVSALETLKSKTGITYGFLGQAQTWLETVDKKGEKLDTRTTATRTATTYDTAEREIGSEETVEDSSEPGLKNITLTTNTVFDSLGRLLRQKKTNTKSSKKDNGSSYSIETILDKENLAYEGWGKQVGSKETLENKSLKTTAVTDRSGSTYNNLGQVKGYTEKVTRTAEIGGVNAKEVRDNVRTDQSYDVGGRLVHWGETRKSDGTPDLLEEVTWDGSLNRDDQVSKYDQTTKKTDRFGPKINQIISIGYSGAIYNSLGQVTAYHQTTNDTAWDKVTETLDWTGGVYNDYGQLTDHSTETTRKDLDGKLDVLTTTHQTGTLYDNKNRATDWTETRSDNRRPNENETITRSGTTYDGEMVTGYVETADVATGVKRTTTLRDTTYDSQFRRDSYIEDVQTKAPGYDVTQSTTRNDTQYNNLGQIEEFNETRTGTDRAGLERRVGWTNGTYDNQGRLKGYEETSHTTGGPIDHEVKVERSNTLYDDLGLTTTYTETTNDKTASEKLTAHMVWTAQSNDIWGRSSGFDRTTKWKKEDGTILSQEELQRRGILYDGSAQVISYSDVIENPIETPDLKVETTWTNGIYTPTGLLTTFNETKRDYDKVNGELDKTTVTTGKGRQYDLLGHMTTESTEREENGQPKEFREWTQGTHDAVTGLLAGYKETVTRIGGAGPEVSETVRSSMVYDEAERVVWYKDEVNNSDSSDVKTTHEVSNTEFNEYGQMKGNRRDTKAKSISNPSLLATHSLFVRNNITYDTLSGMTGYEETETNYTLAQEVDRDRTLIVRNRLGQETSFKETQTRTNSSDTGGLAATSFNLTTVQERTGHTYDNFGRLKKYDQSNTESGIEEKISWTGTLSNMGVVTGFDQTTSKFEVG
ncbi:MAG: hypothetical protein IPN19_01940 [Elusimicrobia bacterium]|nr:hypothetical protein [Elusimicrobiota bacterium]